MGDMVHLLPAWAPVNCDICHEQVELKQLIYMLIRDKYPYRCEDAEDQEYEIFEWHKDCDPGTIAADEAIIPNWTVE